MTGNAPILITAVIVIILAVLACYALFTHSVNNKREKQRLLINSLKTRCRKIEETISCFPPGYLGNKLTVLIQMALVTTFEELNKLQPSDESHKRNLAAANERLTLLSKQRGGENLKSLNNPRQITGTRKNIKLLYKFFQQLNQKGTLSGTKGQDASLLIKDKLALLGVDEQDIQARAALAGGKHQLAAHYFTQARDILLKYNTEQSFNANIKNHSEWIENASNMAKAEQERVKMEKEAHENDSKKWEDADWKKKNIYD